MGSSDSLWKGDILYIVKDQENRTIFNFYVVTTTSKGFIIIVFRSQYNNFLIKDLDRFTVCATHEQTSPGID